MAKTAINKCPFCGGKVSIDSRIYVEYVLSEDGCLAMKDIDRKQEEEAEEENLKIILRRGNVKVPFRCTECYEGLWGKLISKKNEKLKIKLWPVMEEG